MELALLVKGERNRRDHDDRHSLAGQEPGSDAHQGLAGPGR